MEGSGRLECRKYSTLIGAFLLYSPSGVPWYWGNMAVYVGSYFRKHLGVESLETLTLAISLYAIGESLGTALSGILSKKLGHRGSQLLSVLLFDAGVFSGFWLCRESPVGLAVVVGLLSGLTSGVIYAEVLHHIIEWFSEDVGFFTGLVTAGINVGPIVINAVATMYINPQNVAPDKDLGKMKFFYQAEILDKVPWVFVVVGCCNVFLHGLGLLLIRDKITTPILAQTIKGIQTSNSPTHSTQSKQSTKENSQLLPSDKKIVARDAERTASMDDLRRRDFGPKEVLKSKEFYIIWLSTFSGEFANIVLLNFNKSFGQLSIGNDHFLTSISLGITIGAIVFRFLWGLLVDKCGMKATLVTFNALVALLNAFWFFTPRGGQWVYFAYTTFSGCVDIGVYVLSSICMLKQFGRTYFNYNLALIMSAFLVLNFIAPPVQRYILSSLGWFSLFAGVSGLNLLSLALIVAVFPQS